MQADSLPAERRGKPTVISSCAATKSSPHSPQLEKAGAQQQRPSTAKNKFKRLQNHTTAQHFPSFFPLFFLFDIKPLYFSCYTCTSCSCWESQTTGNILPLQGYHLQPHPSFFSLCIFIFIYLAALGLIATRGIFSLPCGMRNLSLGQVESNFLTRDQTWYLCIGHVGS